MAVKGKATKKAVTQVKRKATETPATPIAKIPKKAKKTAKVVDEVPTENDEFKKEELVEEKKNDSDIVVDREHQKECVQTIKGQARVAINSLKKFFSDKGSKSLFPDIDHAMNMQVVYKKASLKGDGLNRKILLPHSPRTPENTTICIIMPDLDRSDKARVDHDVDKQARQWADKLEEDHGIKSGTHVSKIFTYRQLSREYGTHSLKRQLATAYDLFLVDARVAKCARSFLGKIFIQAHKVPVEFKYDRPLVTFITKALKAVNFPVRKMVKRVSIPCGHLGQPTSHLGENVDEIVARVIEHIPGGFINIRSLYLQGANGNPSLPIYIDEGSSNDVNLPEPAAVSAEERETVMECTTLPDGLKIAVNKDGSTRVIKEQTEKEVIYPTIDDEWEPTDDLKPKFDPRKVQEKRETQPLSMKAHAAKNPKRYFKKVDGDLKEESDDVVVDEKRRKTKA